MSLFQKSNTQIHSNFNYKKEKRRKSHTGEAGTREWSALDWLKSIYQLPVIASGLEEVISVVYIHLVVL